MPVGAFAQSNLKKWAKHLCFGNFYLGELRESSSKKKNKKSKKDPRNGGCEEGVKMMMWNSRKERVSTHITYRNYMFLN